jgi:hypothetical protein
MSLKTIAARIVRFPGARSLWLRCPIGSVQTRIAFDIWPRPHYAFGVFAAAQLAKALGLPGISVIEFGVAGGRGLIALQAVSEKIGRAIGIRIDVFGFDSGGGMPEAVDYRDLPHVWAKGFYRMDPEPLKARLTSARLVIGDVGETVPEWIKRGALPIGFLAFDLDYYSSTVKAFSAFDGPPETHLPRVFCYFDDILWPERACHNEFVGELLAIREFNERSSHRKISLLHLLRNMRFIPAAWNDQIYVMHDFAHPLYCVNVTPQGDAYTQHPL